VGDTPLLVAIGDLDGDGNPDLAVANANSDDVSVLLGAGDGSFATQARFGAGISPRSIAIGDLDGDGIPDLAVANGASNDVSVLLGAGDGTFTAQTLFGAGSAPRSVAIGDFDGNTSPDVAVANFSSQNVSIHINQTDVLPPGDFSLLSPNDGAIGLPLPAVLSSWPGGSGSAPVAWGVATGFSNTYAITIALDAALSNIIFQQTGLTELTINVPEGLLEFGTTYYWSVTATNQAGDTVSTPESFTFSTAVPADLNADGVVDGADLGLLLGAWGSAN